MKKGTITYKQLVGLFKNFTKVFDDYEWGIVLSEKDFCYTCVDRSFELPSKFVWYLPRVIDNVMKEVHPFDVQKVQQFKDELKGLGPRRVYFIRAFSDKAMDARYLEIVD